MEQKTSTTGAPAPSKGIAIAASAPVQTRVKPSFVQSIDDQIGRAVLSKKATVDDLKTLQSKVNRYLASMEG